MKLLPRGGYLATCSCSHFATEELFIKMLHSAARDAGVQLRQIEARQQCADHPILWGVEETNYLKFLCFRWCKREFRPLGDEALLPMAAKVPKNAI